MAIEATDTNVAFSDMSAAFDRARAMCGDELQETWYRLAGRPVRVRVAGTGLTDLILRPLAHLKYEPSTRDSPALCIDLWDEAETGVVRPHRYLRDCFQRSWRFGQGALACSQDETILGHQTPGAFAVFKRNQHRIVGSVGDRGTLSSYEMGKPFQPLLFAWHTQHDTILVHAGFVAQGDAGVLFGGAGGSGKSTVSLTCFHAGWNFLGDDYVGIQRTNSGSFRGHSIYNSTWLDPDHSARFGWLSGHETIPGTVTEEKRLFILKKLFETGFGTSATVRALALPKVVGGNETTFRPASKPEALLRLAPSSILQLPFGPGAASLGKMSDLVEHVPTYWLDVGSDLQGIPPCVERLLETVQ